MIIFLAATSNMSESISAILGGLMALLALGLGLGLLILIPIVALITWVVKKVWHAGENREYRRSQREWKKAHKKWEKLKRQEEAEIRNSYKPKRKHQDPEMIVRVWSPTKDWFWDDKAQTWRHKSTLDE